MNYEFIASVCHEANRGICEAAGDYSQQPWAAAEDWQRESAIRGVEFIAAHPQAPAGVLHEAWCQDKQSSGWTYGLEKNAQHKTHPCLVPHAALPFEQRVKDFVFRRIVIVMLGLEEQAP